MRHNRTITTAGTELSIRNFIIVKEAITFGRIELYAVLKVLTISFS